MDNSHEYFHRFNDNIKHSILTQGNITDKRIFLIGNGMIRFIQKELPLLN